MSRLASFADLFTRPTWSNVLVLVAGVVLAPVGALSRRHCASWGAIVIPPSALSIVSSTGGVVIPGRGGPPADPADQGLRDVQCPGRDRARRHHRAALGSQDQRSRHLSRPSPLVQGALRQSQRPALAFCHAAGAGAVGRPIMALPFLRCSPPRNASISAKRKRPRRCLIGLVRPPCKSAAGFPTAILSWSPTAHLQPSNSSPPSATMSASLPACASTPTCSISRRKNAKDRVGRRSRAIVRESFPPSSRIAKSPGSAIGSVSGTAKTTASSRSLPEPRCGIAPGYRRCQSAGCWSAIPRVNSIRRRSWQPISTPIHATSSLGSSALASRSHIRGSPNSSRRRNPASMVGQSNSAHHAGPAQIILHHYTLGKRSRKITKAQTQDRRLVSKNGPDLQRRHRRRAPRNLAPSDFFRVTAAPRQYRNSAPYCSAWKSPRPRCLNRPVELSSAHEMPCSVIAFPCLSGDPSISAASWRRAYSQPRDQDRPRLHPAREYV